MWDDTSATQLIFTWPCLDRGKCISAQHSVGAVCPWSKFTQYFTPSGDSAEQKAPKLVVHQFKRCNLNSGDSLNIIVLVMCTPVIDFRLHLLFKRDKRGAKLALTYSKKHLPLTYTHTHTQHNCSTYSSMCTECSCQWIRFGVVVHSVVS